MVMVVFYVPENDSSLPAPYASDGLDTLHWLSWLNNLGQNSSPKHTLSHKTCVSFGLA